MGNCMACGRFARLDPHTDECPTCRLGEGNPHPDDYGRQDRAPRPR